MIVVHNGDGHVFQVHDWYAFKIPVDQASRSTCKAEQCNKPRNSEPVTAEVETVPLPGMGLKHPLDDRNWSRRHRPR